MNPREIPDIIDKIEEEGNYFVATPPMRANWPLRTDDPASQVQPDHDEDECTDGS